MTLNLTHRNRALCFVLIISVILFCFPRRLSARNLPDEYTTKATQTIKVSNATRHDFSRLVDVQLGSHVSGVSELKRYLHRFGYVKDDGSGSSKNFSDVFDGRLESAISLYQQNLGLPITGRLDTSTVTLMSSPRCGVSDTHMINNGMHVTARYTYFGGKPKWNRDTLTYAFSETHKLDYPTSDDVKTVFRRAFGRWASVIPVSFKEVDDYTTANLKIGFFAGDHGDGKPFDGVLGTLAHAFAPKNGRVHFDAAETWVVNDDFGSKVAVDLESVATHEIGHLLGLGHSSRESAVMYPILPPRTKKVDLTVDDVAGVLRLYGPNPELRLDSLAELKDSLRNGGVSERFLSGNVTASPLFYIQAVFFLFGSATLVCGLNFTRLRLHGWIEGNINKLCDQLKKSSPIKVESGNSNTKKRRSDYDSPMRLLLPSKVCDTTYNNGCNSGFMDYAFEYVVNNVFARKRIILTLWKKELSKCKSGHQDARRNDEKNLLKALAHQSLSVAIDASARDFQRLWGRFGPWCYCSWVWIKQGFRLYHCEKFLGTNMEGGEKGYIRMNTGKPGVSVESIRCFLPHQTEVVISFYPICI
ncbi:hypothetical protein IGI04_012752 [Brassica rapa subsp. trilocularis]|uniref:Peptidase metallopeptidase domain-containing protein n=1 Tax=Brassica rapa subsp. trilocularis TaxID=1813537 RepID=A0ABQ7N7I6_BRACM|nr:hypothetical protein IGI04_012752 [Brassica rapa subsp. trilocularis]